MFVNSFGCLYVNNDLPCFFDVLENGDRNNDRGSCVTGKLILRKKVPYHYKLSGSCPKEMNKMRIHRPSLGRQIVFELIMIIEMSIMLSLIMNNENTGSLINSKVVENKNDIMAIGVGLYVGGLLMKLFYYKLHPWPLQEPNWFKFARKVGKIIVIVILGGVPLSFFLFFFFILFQLLQFLFSMS